MYRQIILFLILASILSLPGAPAQAAVAVARPHPGGNWIVGPDGKPFFVFGYNYEGPFDRAWRMWEQFAPNLIEADLSRARGGGANTVRIFVQNPLQNEILSGDFRKLDAVLEIADRQDLYVLLTLYDYGELDLNAIAEVNRRIAERYRDNPIILAYDLRNEPQISTLGLATYPDGAAIQRADLVPTYGERVSMAQVPAFRSSADGRSIPSWWGDQQVYAYANNLAYFRELVTDAERWVLGAPGRTSVEFRLAPEAQRWQPLYAMLDSTLASWIQPLAAPIRAADPQRMLTIGWSNTLLAGLPANRTYLDIMSIHRFPRPSVANANLILDIGAALRRVHPGRPVLFEEIGFSTHEIDEIGAATLEMAVVLRAYSEGYAGFLKWMLTDLPPVGNPREDNFGALRIDATPKPVYHTFGAFGSYLNQTAAPPGGRINLGSGPAYQFASADLRALAGVQAAAAGVSMRLDAPGHLMLRQRGSIFLLTTQPGELTLDLRVLSPPWNGGFRVERRSGGGWADVTATQRGDTITFGVVPATPYRVSLTRATDPVGARADCRFFPETGHNLCGGFLNYWNANGGLAIFGYPLSEEFTEISRTNGKPYTVQYFERNRFEYHPENAPPYDVLLGLLGNDLTAGRRGEPAFQPAAQRADCRFFPETGHNLCGGFLNYWNANGGLAIFGYPISEEFAEYNPADGRIYTVQYFERNRFEYHPENTPPYDVLLGLLGNQTVDGFGWR